VRLVLPTVIILSLTIQAALAADRPSAEALLALKGDALFAAINDMDFDAEVTFSSDELVRLAEHFSAEMKDLQRSDNRFLFSRFFEAACEKASAKEIEKLVGVYVRLEPSSFDKTFSFRPLASAWIAHEVSMLYSPAVEIAGADEPVPPELRSAPPDLIAAWQLYKHIKRIPGPTFRFFPGKKQISFQANEIAFFRLIDDALLKRGDNIATRLSEFGWSGSSGTGSDFLFITQSTGIFMVLLSEHRIPEAVRAAIEMDIETIPFASEAKDDVRIMFLNKCGLDWESIFAGALLDSEEEGRFGVWSNPFLTELAAYGSNKAAKMVASLAQRAKPDLRENYAEALAAFLSEPAELRYVTGRGFSRINRTPISAEARTIVIGALQRFATTEASSQVASTLLKAFEAAKAPDTKESVRILLKHPSPEVSDYAARILRSMGEKIEMAPVNNAPVRFEVLLNGKPLSPGVKIDYQVQSSSEYRGSDTTSDSEGLIQIERSLFLNPERKPTSVVIRSRGGDHLADPYFWFQTQAPENLDEIIRGNVEVQHVKLMVGRPQQTREKIQSTAKVRLQRHEPKQEKLDDSFVYFDYMQRDFELSLDQPTSLWLQKGVYDVEVIAPGAAKLKQEFTVAGENALDLHLRLEPGGDLRFTIIRPDGQRGARYELFRDGKEVDGDDLEYDLETNTYRSLPSGNYLLHIAASSELASKDSEFLDYAPLQGYVGRDIAFTISDESTLTDLGQIRLESEK
jgi:hypothetical protein